MRKTKRNHTKGKAAGIVILLAAIFLCTKAWNSRTGVYKPAKGDTVSMETLLSSLKEGEVPILYQFDKKWKDVPYGNGDIEEKGCGPTCLSMVLLALLKDPVMDPVYVSAYSEKNGYVTKNSGTEWAFMTEGARGLGLSSEELPLDENVMKKRLDNGALIICAMGPGDFTETGHFIVLTGYDSRGFQVHDPNSKKNSKKSWPFATLQHQIRNLWGFMKGNEV